MEALPVTPLPAMRDNVIWLFPTAPGRIAAVDPGEAGPLLDHLRERGLALSHILITHHHADHVGGVEALRQRTGARVIGAREDQHRLPRLDLAVADGESLPLGQRFARVIATPGHTLGHVVYHVGDALFVGDTLFRFGCGRLFEGTPTAMWESLCRLCALPDNTHLFPGHDYTLLNLPFALSLEPDSPLLLQQQQELLARADDETPCPSLPSVLSLEKRVNPFLRCDDPGFRQALGLAHLSPEQLFAHLRERRNHF